MLRYSTVDAILFLYMCPCWPQHTCGPQTYMWVPTYMWGGSRGLAPGWLPSVPTGKVAPLVKSNYRLTDDFSAALPLNSLKPLKRRDRLICLAPGVAWSGGPFLGQLPPNKRG